MVKGTVHPIMMNIQNKPVDNLEYVPICLNAKIPKVAFILVMCVVGKMIATLEMMNTYVP